ncbi:Bifunctional lysine-specific demethylase and histidyl-hydroxylase NO66 [Porphyridium purpureum]|uniref:Bifunctional lysine-specific demethylase and histidyl-hydroxylase n=1 Tax=Porphyridium purpureum TaxID=35688 RepID=A0A5J4Z736_PORPP|nr:Bifunctional lysine-specific demethylase and histidyl-hydroxylase NO66 [Porphyridium purpureum]|eukprot:POR2187..scf295_1
MAFVVAPPGAAKCGRRIGHGSCVLRPPTARPLSPRNPSGRAARPAVRRASAREQSGTQLQNVRSETQQALVDFFTALRSDARYGKTAFVSESKLNMLAAFFDMNALQRSIENDFLLAVQGVAPSNRTGWYMRSVGEPRGDSFEDAKLRYSDLIGALANGTCVFNSAGGHIKELAELCLAAQDAFRFPANVNVYVTKPGMKKSAPPHTDKQDVIVMQTQGRKHWRVYRPPEPGRKPTCEAFSRGKGDDALSEQELEGLLCIETVLTPGEVLFIPAGWPHTTSTVLDGDGGDTSDSAPSLHLTVGLDHIIWGLTYEFLRRAAIKEAGLKDSLKIYQLSAEMYMDLFEPVNLQASGTDIAAQLMPKLRRIEPEITGDELHALEKIAARIANEMTTHGESVMDLLSRMYVETLNESFYVPPGSPRVTYFHAQQYMARLGAEMEGFLQRVGSLPLDPAMRRASAKADNAVVGSGPSSGFGGGSTTKKSSGKRKSKR